MAKQGAKYEEEGSIKRRQFLPINKRFDARISIFSKKWQKCSIFSAIIVSIIFAKFL